jgi:hypothetical protein
MPFLVQACLDDHTLAVTTATAKDAFAKAVEWNVTGRFTHVSISDATKTYSIDAFALAMALLEIAKTAVGTAEQTAEGNDAGG